MFNICHNKGFQITFANGNTISVQFGKGNYCKPADGRGRYDDDPEFGAEAESAEVAAWPKLRGEGTCDNWYSFGCDQVQGYLTPDEVLSFMNFVANANLAVDRWDCPDMAPASEAEMIESAKLLAEQE